jgi:N-acetylmuramoyl-L-alanine amidase
MVFDKIEHSFWTHDRWFCYWEHYHPYFAYASDPYRFLKSIAQHYATSPTYFDNVWSAIQKHRLIDIDKEVILDIASPWKELHEANQPGERRFTVAVMPGHGGDNPGAINLSLGIHEATYNWLEAEEIKRILEGRGNYQVTICRAQNEFVDLDTFNERANATNADVCLCLHHNADNGLARGWWLFYVKDSPENRKLVKIMDKHFLELPLHARGYDYAGEPLEQDWFSRVCNCIGGCTMPTILFESCFINNDQDCQWLIDGGYKEIAQKICDGVVEYLEG